VENLNSILDDNKKMSLPNGDSIRMSESMCVLLETDHLRNVTPATVSRCGLVFLHRRETYDTKALFNKWLRGLPASLTEYVIDLEWVANYFMVDAVGIYEDEAAAGTLGFPRADLHWVVHNFVKLLDSLVHDYFVDFERSGGALVAPVDPDDLDASLHNVSLGACRDPLEPEPKTKPSSKVEAEAGDSLSEEQAPSSAGGQSRQSSRLSEPRSKVPEAAIGAKQAPQRKRLPRCSFAESQVRLENALKYTAVWLEAFLIYSLVWAFQPVLSEWGRQRLDVALREKYEAGRSDFSSF
jgi:hypothetical protein